jgi:hypothetical protein
MSNIKKPGFRSRLRALETIAGMKLVEGARIETIEKAIQELQDKYEIIEKELIRPLQELQRQSKSDDI